MRAMRPLALSLACVALLPTGASAHRTSAQAPDAIFLDGNVVTMDPGAPGARAFAVAGDRFIAVGSDLQIRRLGGRTTRVQDLHGATVIPGLTDSHDHLWNSAKFLHRGIDMVGVTTWDEMRRRLAAGVARAKATDVVFTTTGWSLPAAPTRADLDKISNTTPILVIAFRRGNAVMNSAALSRLGITRAKPEFRGVKTPVDDDGEPTGLTPSYPASVLMVDALLPPLTPADEDAMVASEMRERNALGITSIRDLSVWPDGLAAYGRMRSGGKLTLRIAAGIEFPDVENTALHLATLGPPRRSDPWFFLDSVSEEPWTPGVFSLDRFTAMAQAVRRLQWRMAPHVSADMARGIKFDDAADTSLDAYEAVDRRRSLKGQRWYLEHVPAATDAEIRRMEGLGVIVSVQDAGYIVPKKPPLSPERMERFNPIRSLIQHHVEVVGGSDYGGPKPGATEPNNPFALIAFWVTRKNEDGQSPTLKERIDRPTALRMLTSNAAYAVFQEKVRGEIRPGMLADFVILNQDIMTVADDRIRSTKPVATYVGGALVYSGR